MTDTIELTIDGMAQGGAGVGRWQGQVVFALGGLPTERVRVQVQHNKGNYLRGVVVDVVEAAPERIPPRLPTSDHMPWQHIDYTAQVGFKETILHEQIRKHTGIANPPILPMLSAARPWHYRNTARLHLAATRDGVQIGYYASGSHTVQPL
ncbi:MAG: TRAM domain-containing protein, partial [Chloroflexaceae bacterium]|nr:TRAM domain-containing protein [Chloroflexaceae bacterium]